MSRVRRKSWMRVRSRHSRSPTDDLAVGATMYQISAFYQHPRDPAAFDDYVITEYSRIAARIPGLIHLTLNWPQPGDNGSTPPFHLVSLMYWEDKDAVGAALAGAAAPPAPGGARKCLETSPPASPSREAPPRAIVLSAPRRPGSSTRC